MLLFLYIEIDAFGLFVLLLLFLNVKKRTEAFLPDQTLFISLIISTAAILIFDITMWAVNGAGFFLAKEINQLGTAIYYSLNPIPCLLWLFYTNYKIFGDKGRFKKRLGLLSIPLIINTTLTIASLFRNILFYIDTNNVYHRGRFFLIMPVMSYSYLLFASIQIIANRRIIKKSDFWPMLLFALPPFIASIIQTLFYQVSIIWICVTASLLMIFISLQNDQLVIDHLTGLYNRRRLDDYLNSELKNISDGTLVAGIMLDINCFKEINDRFGHTAGDYALENAARILKKSIRKEDFIARYGGDEFVIILEIHNEEEVITLIQRIERNLELFSEKNMLPYRLYFSIGYAVYRSGSDMTAQQFLKEMDNKMYADKRRTKSIH